MKLRPTVAHPTGELSCRTLLTSDSAESDKFVVDTFGGRVHIEWEPQAAVTRLGQLAFFIDYLKLGDIFEPWVNECPIKFRSPNAPLVRDILGTLLLSTLSGHTRYAHVTALRGDGVNPGLLGLSKIVSEDSLRRSFLKIEREAGIEWLQKHLHRSYEPLLAEPWIMDVDTTVKVLYGNQEGAVVGYNPKKPGRPSHTYHAYTMGNLRLVLDVEVHAGNETAASYTAPDLWSLLERLPREQWPQFIRGDCAFGTDGVMRMAEEKGVPYLFKLKLTPNVKRLIDKLKHTSQWSSAGEGFEGLESRLKLHGWKKERKVIILRNKISEKELPLSGSARMVQKDLPFSEPAEKGYVYKYSMLVTSLPDEVMTITQHYRDRADSENILDELKNQWGWGGFTTQDLTRCCLMARIVGLIYNWWNLFVRIAEPDKYREAITSRPLLLDAVGKQTSHSGQTFISISNSHGKKKKVKKLLTRITTFFNSLKDCAEQLTGEERWYRILSKAVEKYLNGRVLEPPKTLPAPA
jgi:hypothetical protein